MRITQEQSEKAIAIRALIKSNAPENSNAWTNYIDFSRAVAQMIDGLDTFVSPDQMKGIFDRAYSSFAQVWSEENKRIILEILDGNEEVFNAISDHPNAIKIIHRILVKIKKELGPLGIGTVVTGVDISDILLEEGIIEKHD